MPQDQLQKTYDKDFYSRQIDGSSRSASVIVPKILEILPFVKSVIDIGCGTGVWLHHFHLNGVTRIQGIDGGEPSDKYLQIPAAQFRRADLVAPIAIAEKFDLALSLEVAEHIPASAASKLVKTLADCSDVIVFAAAIPGQGGTNHINEQWLSYWCSLFNEVDYRCFDVLRGSLWSDQRIEWWYAQNIVIFVNTKQPQLIESLTKIEVNSVHPIDMVHPRCFEGRRRAAQKRRHLYDALPGKHIFSLLRHLITFRLGR